MYSLMTDWKQKLYIAATFCKHHWTKPRKSINPYILHFMNTVRLKLDLVLKLIVTLNHCKSIWFERTLYSCGLDIGMYNSMTPCSFLLKMAKGGTPGQSRHFSGMWLPRKLKVTSLLRCLSAMKVINFYSVCWLHKKEMLFWGK